jgi:hypothetical protein
MVAPAIGLWQLDFGNWFGDFGDLSVSVSIAIRSIVVLSPRSWRVMLERDEIKFAHLTYPPPPLWGGRRARAFVGASFIPRAGWGAEIHRMRSWSVEITPTRKIPPRFASTGIFRSYAVATRPHKGRVIAFGRRNKRLLGARTSSSAIDGEAH